MKLIKIYEFVFPTKTLEVIKLSRHHCEVVKVEEDEEEVIKFVQWRNSRGKWKANSIGKKC